MKSLLFQNTRHVRLVRDDETKLNFVNFVSQLFHLFSDENFDFSDEVWTKMRAWCEERHRSANEPAAAVPEPAAESATAQKSQTTGTAAPVAQPSWHRIIVHRKSNIIN